MFLYESGLTLGYVLRIAKKYYSTMGYDHSIRVMQFVAENTMIQSDLQSSCLALAVAHDLWEDTDCPLDTFGNKRFSKALLLLTRTKDQPYIEYIKNIRENRSEDFGLCAWWVKMADMKDHLSQTGTLTPKLKDKYLSAIPYLI